MSEKYRWENATEDAGKVLSGELPIEEMLRRARESYEEEQKDIARLDWLQSRGRVKSRMYGEMKNNWKWDWTDGKTLREAIDEAMR